MKFEKIEENESSSYVDFRDATKKLGQAQYISRFINPNPKLHEDGTPYFEGIRTEGNLDDYYDIKIHADDLIKFVERWLEYKKETNPLYKNNKIEDFL